METNRELEIAQFAKQYGLQLAFYKQGLCAIFEKKSSCVKVPGDHR